ncbi:unnamed protein product [Hapterophycus canaliculatus]
MDEAVAIRAPHGDPFVPKTAFSNKMRLVFIVGLEGAGHHYITGAIQDMFRENPPPSLNGTLFRNDDAFFLPAIMSESSAAFDEAVDEAHRDMVVLAQHAERLPPPGTFYMMHGQSFPSGYGIHKVMQYMDPRLIAEAAEAGGVDLRVLYLRRPARELLLADTVHRRFQDHLGKPSGSNDSPEELFMEIVRIILTDGAVVHSFLAELDPAFVVCHDWDLFGDPDQAQKLGNFIAPSSDVALLVKTALVSSASAGPRNDSMETLPFDRDEVMSSRIQRKLDSFEYLYCGRKTN